MQNMVYFDPNFQHYQHQHEQQIGQQVLSHFDAQHMHNYALAHQNAQLMAMPPAKTNETKPRLGKDEVDILEREFRQNPKPTTKVKREFAREMGVELPRINNWFQNRRAKRKQVDKQQAYEAGQAQEALGLSDSASSPDLYNANGFCDEMQQQQPSSFSLMSGPPPAAASYNPQYSDPTGASMESLQRTMAVAQASHQDYHTTFVDHNNSMNFGDSMIHESTEDRAQFPAPESLVTSFDTYAFPSTFTNNIYNSPQSTSDLGFSSADDMTNQTPMPYDHSTTFNSESSGSQTMTTFPSQLLSQQFEGLPSLTNDSSESQSQSPQESSTSHHSPDFKVDIDPSGEDDDLSLLPPAPSIPFKSPAPMDIASRRKKVQQKPSNLVSETLRNRPSMGPRTVSHADGFRRGGVESPLASPMRRIVSAGGNRPGGSVISGRICKPGAESAQRSPINIGGFADAGAFMPHHDFRRIRNPPSLTALSSLNSSLAPPTPMSPREREMTFKREGPTSTASSREGSMNSYVFNGSVPGCFTTMEGDQNLSSPPVTPQNLLVPPGSGWPAAVDFQDRQWAFEVPDEPLYTPANENFNPDLQMPQPSYLGNMSQPVTPAFGRFNPALMFGQDGGSPQFKHESPQYTLSTQNSTEYAFPDAQGQYPAILTSATALAKQKTFQFSHTTQADFPKK